MNKILAIFLRDARLALSYPASFWMRWVSTALAVLGFAMVSRLVPPSVHLGVAGSRGTYFDYVVINVAFFSLQATALQSFSQAIRNDQFCGTLEPLLSTPTPLALTHGLNAMRAALAGASWSAGGADILWLNVASLILLPIALLTFGRSVQHCRVDGTLGHY